VLIKESSETLLVVGRARDRRSEAEGVRPGEDPGHCFRFRNKIGLSVAIEGLRLYLSKQGCPGAEPIRPGAPCARYLAAVPAGTGVTERSCRRLAQPIRDRLRNLARKEKLLGPCSLTRTTIIGQPRHSGRRSTPVSPGLPFRTHCAPN